MVFFKLYKERTQHTLPHTSTTRLNPRITLRGSNQVSKTAKGVVLCEEGLEKGMDLCRI